MSCGECHDHFMWKKKGWRNKGGYQKPSIEGQTTQE